MHYPMWVKIDQESLVQSKHFVYLGSIISENAKLDCELTFRIEKGSTAFGLLQDRLWKNCHVSIRVKCLVYHMAVLSTLLYGAETWPIYRPQVLELHAYMIRHLRLQHAPTGKTTSPTWKYYGEQAYRQ